MEMNIVKYMAFIKTVELGSFTKAAELLNYSQSGISRMISDLEAEWGVRLLERNRSGVRLTSDGMEVLPYVRKICSDYEGLQSQVSEIKGLESGIIRIGTFSSVATHWLPKIIKDFQNDYPNIDYELRLGDYTEIQDWITEGSVDCGFLRDPSVLDMDIIPLQKDELIAVIPQGHPLEKYDKVPLSALCDYPFMLLEKGSKSNISKLFEEHGLKPQIKFTTWDDYAIMSMVENGLGIGILPKLILQRMSYQIVEKELAEPAYLDICLALRNKDDLSFATKRFIEYLL